MFKFYAEQAEVVLFSYSDTEHSSAASRDQQYPIISSVTARFEFTTSLFARCKKFFFLRNFRKNCFFFQIAAAAATTAVATAALHHSNERDAADRSLDSESLRSWLESRLMLFEMNVMGRLNEVDEKLTRLEQLLANAPWCRLRVATVSKEAAPERRKDILDASNVSLRDKQSIKKEFADEIKNETFFDDKDLFWPSQLSPHARLTEFDKKECCHFFKYQKFKLSLKMHYSWIFFYSF